MFLNGKNGSLSPDTIRTGWCKFFNFAKWPVCPCMNAPMSSTILLMTAGVTPGS